MNPKRKKIINSPKNTYEGFLKEISVIAIGLDSSRSQLNRRELMELFRNEKRELRAINVKYELKDVHKNSFDAHAKLTLKFRDKESDRIPLEIDCEFTAHFHGHEPINKVFAKRFTGAEFRIIIWPYFRQFVSDMTSRMYIGTIALPFSFDSAESEQPED